MQHFHTPTSACGSSKEPFSCGGMSHLKMNDVNPAQGGEREMTICLVSCAQPRRSLTSPNVHDTFTVNATPCSLYHCLLYQLLVYYRSNKPHVCERYSADVCVGQFVLYHVSSTTNLLATQREPIFQPSSTFIYAIASISYSSFRPWFSPCGGPEIRWKCTSGRWMQTHSQGLWAIFRSNPSDQTKNILG